MARRNAQIFSAAQSRDQASIVFGLAAKMVRMSHELNELVTVRDSAKQLFCPGTGVVYRALSAEATTAYGLSPVLVIHDEDGQFRPGAARNPQKPFTFGRRTGDRALPSETPATCREYQPQKRLTHGGSAGRLAGERRWRRGSDAGGVADP